MRYRVSTDAAVGGAAKGGSAKRVLLLKDVQDLFCRRCRFVTRHCSECYSAPAQPNPG